MIPFFLGERQRSTSYITENECSVPDESAWKELIMPRENRVGKSIALSIYFSIKLGYQKRIK